MIVQRAGDVIPQVVGPVLPRTKRTKPFRMPAQCPLCGVDDRQARGRGHAPLPEPRVPVARARVADQLGEGRDGHRGRRRAVRAPALERGPRSARCPTSTASRRSSSGARRLRRDLGDATRSRRSRRRGEPVRARALRAQHPGGRLGDGAEPRAALRHRRRAARRDARRSIEEVDGIGPDRAEPIAEWFADEENRRLVDELRELGLRFEAGEEDRPVEGPLTGQHVRDHRARSSASRATRRQAALEAQGREGRRLGLEEDDRRVRRRGAGQSKLTKAQQGRACDVLDEDGPASSAARAGLGRPRARSRTGPAPCAPTTCGTGEPFWTIANA